MPQVDWAPILSSLFAGLSALAAVAAIYFPWRTQKSQRFLDQSTLSLERAYEVLSSNGQIIQPPAPDRLNWLTTARHLERYQRLKELIKCEEHQLVCEEHEEYWRHRFHVCLNGSKPIMLGYYQENLLSEGQLGIEPKSAIIVHDFAKWPDGKNDPVDLADIESILNRENFLKGNSGLRYYLESLPDYNKKT